MMRIGVPRAFSFYRFHPAWTTFFEKLGAEVVVSSQTTRATLEAGKSFALAEHCLPLKLFFGHVHSLIGQVDVLLIPSIQRLAHGSTNCANLIGLPDILKSLLPDLPPMIAPDIDLSDGERAVWMMVLKEGGRFSRNPLLLREAAQSAWADYLRARAAMLERKLTPDNFDDPNGKKTTNNSGLPVAVIGHPYNLYDQFMNHNLLARLERLGIDPLTPERMGPWPTPDYWTFEYELVGAARLALQRENVMGCISVAAFGCGADAVMLDEVQKLTDSAGIPLMNITLDEHSGEAGLVTRIEAFVDMLAWRQKKHG
jgi:predicted nucleotide-binding protein (sugar kinase/HSP70/actin superfamily)